MNKCTGCETLVPDLQVFDIGVGRYCRACISIIAERISGFGLLGGPKYEGPVCEGCKKVKSREYVNLELFGGLGMFCRACQSSHADAILISHQRSNWHQGIYIEMFGKL